MTMTETDVTSYLPQLLKKAFTKVWNNSFSELTLYTKNAIHRGDTYEPTLEPS